MLSDREMFSTVGTVTKLPPLAPLVVRINDIADSSRSASRIVGRLTPN